jgi:hypothetical protein
MQVRILPVGQRALESNQLKGIEMSNVTTIFTVAALILLIITLVVAGPIFTILALNTLFTLSIPITFWTWLSTAWLGFILIPKDKSK